MAYFGSGVEYGLHCLLYLVADGAQPASSRDLAELQGVSPSFVAKIFPKLEKAGIVRAWEGVHGGYRLARAPERISVLDVAEAIEGRKDFFDCQEIRGRCAVFDGQAPGWAADGMCAIHAVMVRAEKTMRDELAQTTLADLAAKVNRKAPAAFRTQIQQWLDARARHKGDDRQR